MNEVLNIVLDLTFELGDQERREVGQQGLILVGRRKVESMNPWRPGECCLERRSRAIHKALIRQVYKHGIVAEERRSEEGPGYIRDPKGMLRSMKFAEGDGEDALPVLSLIHI